MSKALDTGKIVVGVFLDFKKAFDTVDHTILLRKRKFMEYEEKCTIGSPVISITEDNVCIIMIITQRKTHYSWCTTRLDSGTSFIIYKNDFSRCSDLLFSILFADDTGIFIEGTNYDKIIYILNKELKQMAKSKQTDN